MKPTVICVTYNQPTVTTWLLMSLEQQMYEGPWQLILCDDGSDSDILSALRAFSPRQPVDVSYVWQAKNGFRLSHARNKGIRVATGDLLIFVDGDMFVQPTFLSEHVRLHREVATTRRSIVAGPRTSVHLDNPRFSLSSPTAGDILEYLKGVGPDRCFKGRPRFPLTGPDAWMNCIGYNLSVDDSEDVLFDERFIGWGDEDREFVYRLVHRAGYNVLYSESLRSYHVHLSSQALQLAQYDRKAPESIVAFMKNRLRLHKMYPEIDLDRMGQRELQRLKYNSSTECWTMTRSPDVSASSASILAEFDRWLKIHEPDAG